MPNQVNQTSKRQEEDANRSFVLGLIAAVLFFVGGGIVEYLNIRTIRIDTGLVTHTHEVLTALSEIESSMGEAESGQRGFMLTGSDEYLKPYQESLPKIAERVDAVQLLTSDNPHQQSRIAAIREAVKQKLAELAETIEIRRTKGLEAALVVIRSDRGRLAMEKARQLLQSMEKEEVELRVSRLAEMEDSYRVALSSLVLTVALGLLLSVAVVILLRRAAAARRKEEWILRGRTGLSAALLGELRLDEIGDKVLSFLASHLDSLAGAFFVRDGVRFRRVATYGVPAGAVLEEFSFDDSLLGQAAKNRRIVAVADVPDRYLSFGTAFSRGTPPNLLVMPAVADHEVNAVLELGFLTPPNAVDFEFLETVKEGVSSAVRAANYRVHLQSLLEETQRQAEELQAQSEELRVSNEELEEQGRALKLSQSRLEQQQSELEQTNAQLEEQAQFLETQRDDLSRAKATLELKARELEQASRYKSDFLANMSHELRTPLNSSLILAKILADNSGGNLTEEQIRYAETIQSAGNDLLNLINDILDLSKIEAGHMDVVPEPIPLSHLVEGLSRTFAPLAAEKGLGFTTDLHEGSPESIATDRRRLEQVLKNLLANAIKFTESGEIALTISPGVNGTMEFTILDTGIGIEEAQLQLIFEAFRQADANTNRRYGGTGLGLSISRELARLLGGEISVESEPGKGSRFTVCIPATYDRTVVRQRFASPEHLSSARFTESPHTMSPPALAPRDSLKRRPPKSIIEVEDDRRALSGERTILVVEDDRAFAKIIYDLAHELKFNCLVASTAEEGLALAAENVLSAVILDVGLPDHSGLTVLDRLKRDPRTRHVPVHIVSAFDSLETAMSLGAAEYIRKPIQREELERTLRRLEDRLSQRVRRVLIVEDDAVQLESMRRLIGSAEVETVGAGTAAACLAELRNSTFDCVVLDLSLPDASGYSLLETLSTDDSYSFPPVIVYTGRDLSAEEEQRLRRYSRSIIIKGAKSPERLLDELTLFLHQVVAELPLEQQRMLERVRNRDAVMEDRRILVVEDDVRNVFALASVLEPRGAKVEIARNGREALETLDRSLVDRSLAIDLILMDVMMPEMDGITATLELRKRPELQKTPVIMLTAKAMRDDQERCLAAGANDYMAKPLDIEKLLSLIRVWMPR